MTCPFCVKICGITSERDAILAVDAGADAIGINLYPRSPRAVGPDFARLMLAALPEHIPGVYVLVNTPHRTLPQVASELRPATLFQLHGDSPDSEPPPYPTIPAVRLAENFDLLKIQEYLSACRALGWCPPAILVDGHSPHVYGGSGRKAPWELLAEFRPGVPLILAGGLTPDNVADAIRTVRPNAVDTASGVEVHPRQKDPRKVRRFIAAARDAFARFPPFADR